MVSIKDKACPCALFFLCIVFLKWVVLVSTCFIPHEKVHFWFSCKSSNWWITSRAELMFFFPWAFYICSLGSLPCNCICTSGNTGFSMVEDGLSFHSQKCGCWFACPASKSTLYPAGNKQVVWLPFQYSIIFLLPMKRVSKHYLPFPPHFITAK